jgi:NACalpha-BTF3-like transcription factor
MSKAKHYFDSEIREDFIQIVMEQTNCSRERAITALEKEHNDIVKAILRIQECDHDYRDLEEAV